VTLLCGFVSEEATMNPRRKTLPALAVSAAALGLLGCGSEDASSGLIVQDAIASVKINEALARNNPTYGTAHDLCGEYDDWIELINTGTEEAELGGFWLSDRPRDPLGTALPDWLTLSAGERILLWADDQAYHKCAEGEEVHLGFRLGAADGDDVVLSGPDGELMDSIRVPPQPQDASAPVSAARCPDGSGEVKMCDSPTPTRPNSSCCQED
jgi:hypothetical protein